MLSRILTRRVALLTPERYGLVARRQVASTTPECYQGIARQRNQLLKRVYAPFGNLDRNSSEFKELALSGKVWEDYHKPGDSEKLGYFRLQQV
jgi:hypothetical protein